MNNNTISSRQMVIMLVMFRVTMSLSYFLSMDFPPSNQDNWITILFSSIYIILFSLPLLFLTNKFSGFDMIEYFSIILGKWVGKIVIILYGIYFLTYTIYLVVLQNQLVAVSVLPRTINLITISFILVLALYMLSKGIILLFWSAELIASAAFGGIIILILLGLKNVDIMELFPILRDSSFKDLNKGSFLTSLIFVDIFLLTIGGKFLEDKKKINKILLKSVVYSQFTVTIILIVIQTSVGLQQASHAIYPFLLYTRLIKYSSILERIDLLYVITWLSLHGGKVGLYLLFSLKCFKEGLNIKKNKLITLCLMIIVLIVSNLLANRVVLGINIVLLTDMLYIPFIFTTILPCFISIVYFFRRKTLKKYTIEERQL
ncbi:GerAB/ArcD/ProY family transporter [Tissierella creatinophila]|uniref:Spore germination protein YndE n=1 Tax=Tissierella creatinophila DSM 6911 TaxID=1123403 RepID=A0A1U7M8J1_TISCR|nr:GerAB/ArcD/ProY family transporter [Tissierella creatinophila]OLS03654.1 spore germination protein YndE [Tissierella creatinophila DSM 6911]